MEILLISTEFINLKNWLRNNKVELYYFVWSTNPAMREKGFQSKKA